MAYTVRHATRFEWDRSKNVVNRFKHGLSFENGIELLRGRGDYLEIYDAEHSDEEDRFIAIGRTRHGVVVVIYTERDDEIVRILSVRRATRGERRAFLQL
jgi:uncharacterized protein